MACAGPLSRVMQLGTIEAVQKYLDAIWPGTSTLEGITARLQLQQVDVAAALARLTVMQRVASSQPATGITLYSSTRKS